MGNIATSRVAAESGPFLKPIEEFYCGIAIQNDGRPKLFTSIVDNKILDVKRGSQKLELDIHELDGEEGEVDIVDD